MNVYKGKVAYRKAVFSQKGRGYSSYNEEG